MASIADTPRVALRQRLTPSSVENILSAVVLAGVVAALVYGWLHRDGGLPDPEHGLGYALGIIGGSMMIILLGYPLRKRAKAKSIGSVGFWFRFHMLLGLLGPTAVLYHSRFTFGSLNSAVALGAMIVVASSGLVGRFLYARVHRGYSGRKLELRGLKLEMDETLAALEAEGISHAQVLAQLQPFEDRAVEAGRAFGSSAWAVVDLGIRSRLAERRIRRNLPRAGSTELDRLHANLAHFFVAVRRSAAFAFYDRLLRLWHLLHLPLFFMLVAAAILHIVAVHMY
jgi:hypothetical protein